ANLSESFGLTGGQDSFLVAPLHQGRCPWLICLSPSDCTPEKILLWRYFKDRRQRIRLLRALFWWRLYIKGVALGQFVSALRPDAPNRTLLWWRLIASEFANGPDLFSDLLSDLFIFNLIGNSTKFYLLKWDAP
ncbi:MAG: hypothetical protein J7M14_00250, partial [Planctomycetes bacterium]|nr:hypothetical protein [Planctomycetota bacterium]